ncbi:MAG: ABC transporter substrate-binding protein [Alcanivorax sp.]|jgi:ABC-type nitrate/sulfonate/bicarbonate transport system substrate-binding protein|uniref:Nitrate transporter n=1 Tax=Alloalcanivorax venustensis ISO4 TaxID=1177184 RepID=A0ABS0AEC1_9GAMM|nr:CmpA/NrtA family ABC transporter substrate-binding protein [Alloalcanivorax venustensis]MBD3652256.1 ABC transporter substrate-binding protein [Alcanivorax sp.]MBF5052498.1 nitrate transporter [Alloalcanivorax venustensis ISO4]
MKTDLTLGYMPLTDSLPLLAAAQLGFFRDQGLDVTLQEEVSWANIRDKVIVGQFDGAHMLAPMVMASTLGLGGLNKPLIAPYSLNLGGNGMTLSASLYRELESTTRGRPGPASLKQLIEQRKLEKQPPLVLAVVFPYSSHNLLLRYWLASAGIDPDRDVTTVVLPPSQMVDHLRLGHIHGFFAGEPWNAVATADGIGCCVATGRDIWQNAPNKVLGVTEDWARANPDTLDALLRALYRAGAWLDGNRAQAVSLLAEYLPVDRRALAPALLGHTGYRPDSGDAPEPDLLVFHRYLANFPWVSHGYWFLNQMARWGWLPGDQDLSAVAAACYRPDLYRRALADTPLPGQDWKGEGIHAGPWRLETSQGEIGMGADTFIDGEEWQLRSMNFLHQSAP